MRVYRVNGPLRKIADLPAGRPRHRRDAYTDWPEAYNEDRRRGKVAGVDYSIRLHGRPGVRRR